jgi:hypothetical protein
LFNGQPLIDRHLNEGDQVCGDQDIDDGVFHVEPWGVCTAV